MSKICFSYTKLEKILQSFEWHKFFLAFYGAFSLSQANTVIANNGLKIIIFKFCSEHLIFICIYIQYNDETYSHAYPCFFIPLILHYIHSHRQSHAVEEDIIRFI